MCKAMEDMRDSVRKEAEKKTKEERVLRWIGMGLTHEQIAKGEDLTIEEVKNIADKVLV